MGQVLRSNVALVIAFGLGLLLTPLRHVVAAVLGGLVWAVLAWPAYRIARRSMTSVPAASLALIVSAVLVLAPLVLVGAWVLQDLRHLDIAGELASWEPRLAALPAGSWLLDLLEGAATRLPEELAAAGLLAFLQLPLMVVVAFLALKRGMWLWLRLQPQLPLAAPVAVDLAVRTRTVLRGVVRGQLLTAIAKGSVGALGFWVAGVPGVALWGTVMVAFTFLPVLAAWMVWLPACLWLAAQGQTLPAGFLLFWGAVVMGLLDNVLRPMLVGREARIHPACAMVGMAAGAAAFGLVGLLAGPVLLDVAMGWRHARRTGRSLDPAALIPTAPGWRHRVRSAIWRVGARRPIARHQGPRIDGGTVAAPASPSLATHVASVASGTQQPL